MDETVHGIGTFRLNALGSHHKRLTFKFVGGQWKVSFVVPDTYWALNSAGTTAKAVCIFTQL